MYEDILFPFDGSDGATEVLHHAAEIADWADGAIRLLYVADTTATGVTRADETVNTLLETGEEILGGATTILEGFGTEYTTDVTEGTPAVTIVEYADRYDSDVIVMPTQGRTGLSRYLLGSVTEKVVRLAEVPVLTVRMQPDERVTYPYKRILVPTDGSSGAEHAAQHALELAGTLDASVHVLSVVDSGPHDPKDPPKSLTRVAEDIASESTKTVANAAQRHGITDVSTQVEYGSPHDEILECVENEAIDAIVMGTTGRRNVKRVLLGSVAEKTVRSAPVPVVTVHGTDGDTMAF